MTTNCRSCCSLLFSPNSELRFQIVLHCRGQISVTHFNSYLGFHNFHYHIKCPKNQTCMLSAPAPSQKGPQTALSTPDHRLATSHPTRTIGPLTCATPLGLLCLPAMVHPPLLWARPDLLFCEKAVLVLPLGCSSFSY